MSIKSIEIKNFKSIEYIKFNLNEMNVFIGKNGAGKTTIQKAVKYFYKNLLKNELDNSIFDELNPLKKKMSITIEYEFSRIFDLASGSYWSELFRILYIPDPFRGVLKNNRKILKLSLYQTKEKGITWSHDYDIRYIVKNSHPIYFLYPREKDLLDWDDLWNALGDLVNANAAKNFSDDLTQILPKKDADLFKEYILLLEKFFDEQHLKILQDSNTNKTVSLLKLYLGGNSFISDNKTLDYYSDGTNSKNYILFLTYIAYIISMKRLKDVSLFLDEPELGLHPRMIDELMDSITMYSTRVKFILFSHSPRLTSHVLKNSGDVFKLTIKDSYSHLNKLVKNDDLRSRMLVTEREAGFLYSDFLLLTEGITEYELFNHRYLKKLFPILKTIDVIHADSNDLIINLLNPENNKSEIPYLILIDLDKIIDFNFLKHNEFKLKYKKLKYTVLKNETLKEKMIKSFHKYEQQLKSLKTIEKRENEIFNDNSDIGILPQHFDDLYRQIKALNLTFNVYPLKVVIENAIVSNEIFPLWLANHKKLTVGEENFLQIYSTPSEKHVLQSYIVSGKNEFLKNIDTNNYPSKFKPYIKEFENLKMDKNSGWVTKYFNFYEELAIERQWSLTKQEKKFNQYFPLIYDIIKEIEKIKK